VDDDMALGLITCYKVSAERNEERRNRRGRRDRREQSERTLAQELEDSKVIYLEGLTTCYMIYMWHTYKSCEASHHPMRLII